MATILKWPSGGLRGIVTLTDRERDAFVLTRPELQETIRDLKDRWIVGLHHNWHDFEFAYDPLFDFSMSGAEDLGPGPHDFPFIPMDAANFVPAEFRPSDAEKFWDILYIARPAFFKGYPDFLQTVRDLYDAGRDYRVLAIAPMPPYDRKQRKTVFYELRDVYASMFSEDEQNRFTLLATGFRYPFPFDLPTLAHFYRSSRSFVYFATDERRPRVVAYAWATGLPVIARESVSYLLPEELRRPPAYYGVGPGDSFADAITGALETSDRDPETVSAARNTLSDPHARDELRSWFARLFGDDFGADDGSYRLDNLGLRVARHHRLAEGPNRIDMDIEDFLAFLRNSGSAQTVVDASDPELRLAELRGTREPATKRRWRK
jgi:glycosyltransferase involved in cell wall biosynthesis